MSKARDIANILSANTPIATDAEVSSAISSHSTMTNGHVGRGTTGNRPSLPTIGDLYFDTTLNALIAYKESGWEKVSQDPAPQIASISPTTAATTGTVITITGANFKSGLAVQFVGTNAVSYNSPVAVFGSATMATATTPALPVEYEPYDIKLTNNDNQFAILENALDSGGTPIWDTPSGSIGTVVEQTLISLSVSATDPDGTSIIYSSSNLPSWLSLNSSTGQLSGTTPDILADTTYSFDITASDGVNSSTRSFSITSTYVVPTLSVEYLVIGGGGGGSGMGGGGAGGFRDGTMTVPMFTSLNMSIGSGAAGAVAGQNCTSRGGNSVFHSITATGGGSGCSNTVAGTTPDPISNGGSSAGAQYNGQIAAAGNAGGYTPVEGYPGGGPNINGWQSGGGGGGAGGAGSWQGGPGKVSSITGSAITYAGGGGGGKGDQAGNGASGGSGGGGTGGGWGYSSYNQPTSGSFYGAGGGGIGYAQSYNGGSGYQGVVILKYDSSKTLNATGFTASTTTSGSFKITTITAGTGTVSFS